tara:strand:- start:59 stop:2914 length:2856 start_codon:yes stop_codon:yes gene_type:complete
MAINLKEILVSDIDNIKLDKVNYNFDQLVANGGGPRGVQGNPGDTGYQGVTGYQGNQGIEGNQGVQGNQGSNGQDIWFINPYGQNQADTILPVMDPLSNGAPSVLLGYKTTDDEYTTTDPTQVEENSQVVINRHSTFYNNLELKTVGFNTTFAFKLDADVSTGNALMQTYFVGGNGSQHQYANEFSWRIPGTTSNLIKLDADTLEVGVHTIFKQNVVVQGDLKIATGNPGLNKIATSADIEGKIVFKNIEDIGGTVPVGTIISMLPAYFDDNSKFINTHTVTPIDAEPINIYVGRGVGEYAGWYICNGKTWGNDSAITFITPDLNSFSYSIEDNPNSTLSSGQGLASVTNDEIPIIGGADTSLTATYNNGTSVFDVTGTVQTSPDLIKGTSGATFTIKRLPQIIYLGKEDLTWTDIGTDHAPVAAAMFMFIDDGIIAPAAVVSMDPLQRGIGSSGTFNITIPAPLDQYWDNDKKPVISTPDDNNYTIINRTVNEEEQNKKLHIQVSYNYHTKSPEQVGNTLDHYTKFRYNSDSLSSIVVIPVEETIVFTFTDTNDFIDQKTRNQLDINGTDGSFDVSIATPNGYYWTEAPGITLPGYTIANSTPTLTSSNNDGYNNVWNFTVTYSSFPYSGPVNFNYSSTQRYTAIPAVEMQYTISGGIAKNSSNRDQTITAELGSTVTLSEVTLKAAIDNYWRAGVTPTITSAQFFDGSAPIFRTGDFSITSFELEGAHGDAIEQPSLLKLTIRDNDFGNETETPGGLDSTVSYSSDATAITINHPYDQILQTKPYIRGTGSQWTGGRNGWNRNNITHYNDEQPADSGEYPKRTQTIENNTGEQVNIRIKVSRSSQASVNTGASIRSRVTPGSNVESIISATTNTNDPGQLISGENSYTTYSGYTLPIPAGEQIDIEWYGVTPQNDNSNNWAVTLQYYVGESETDYHNRHTETLLTYLAY